MTALYGFISGIVALIGLYFYSRKQGVDATKADQVKESYDAERARTAIEQTHAGDTPAELDERLRDYYRD